MATVACRSTTGHAIEDVLGTAEMTFNEYQNASKILASDASALLILSVLGLALDRVRDRLESTTDDDEVLQRLESITIGGLDKQCFFLTGLDMDLRATCIYLQNAGSSGSPLKKDEVDIYAQTLDRYGRVLKVVQKRNMKDIVQRIETEVLRLNEALTAMRSHLYSTSKPSEEEMLGALQELAPNHAPARLNRLRPVLSAFHNSRGAVKPCQEGTREDVLSDIFNWLNSSEQSNDSAMVFWMHGYGRSWSQTSAVAQSVATQAHKEGRLLASFFSSSTWILEPERRDPANLIPTVVYQLAHFERDFLRRIAHAISIDRDIRDKDAKTQISVLLKEPFKDVVMPSGPTPLIVIDALDAFEHLNEPDVAQDIALFIQALTARPLRVKIFITSLYPKVTEPILKNPHFPAHQVYTLRLSESELREDQARDQANADWAARNGLGVYTPERTYAPPRTPPRRYDGRPGQIVRLGT